MYDTGIQARCASREVPEEWAPMLPETLDTRMMAARPENLAALGACEVRRGGGVATGDRGCFSVLDELLK